MAGNSRRRDYDVIVIGAGVAGLASAARLYENAHFRQEGKLLVLEARDRIGGRINAVYVEGCRLDTGANWIHGIGTDDRPNPLMNIVPHKRLRQLSGAVAFKNPHAGPRPAGVDCSADNVENEDGWVKLECSFPRRTGSDTDRDLVIPPQVAGPLMGTLWSMIESLHEAATTIPAGTAKQTMMLKTITQTEEFREAYNQTSPEYYSTLGSLPSFIENIEAAPLVAQSAEHPEGQAGFSLLEYALEDFEGEQVFLQDGYLAVLDEVARDLIRDGVVRLGTPMHRVRWAGDKVEIETADGVFTAKEVICTLPLGVLQRQSDHQSSKSELFKPPLPKAKQEAIYSLGYGTLDKIFLIYKHAWWLQDPFLTIIRKGMTKQRFDAQDNTNSSNGHQTHEPPDSFMGFTTELPGFEIPQDGTVGPGARTLSLINLHNLTGFPVLSCFVSCANARQVEAMTDDEAGAMLQRALTDWFGHPPPETEAVHVTRWAKDEYSRGSYSHMITGLSEVKHREEFQRPIVSEKGAVIRFAGEHTSRNHFATVHGALLSGWREADVIIQSSK